MKDTNRLYTDLAWLWPLWGDPTEKYALYCEHVTQQIRRYATQPVTTLLNLGCGGGKNVLNLKRDFEVTGVDISPTMLAQAKQLNPECDFVEADMRSCSLDRSFDAVLMDDAISYMNTLSDFKAAIQTAHSHLNPGGVMVITPDVTTETFVQNSTTSTTAARDGVEVVFVENVYDPDPSDEHYETTILYLIRQNGQLRIETDHWTLGLFSINTYRNVLRETGFEFHEERFGLDEDEYTVFVCLKSPN